jgi:hypothetical protein
MWVRGALHSPLICATENSPCSSLMTDSKHQERGINVVGGLQGLCQVNLVAASPRSEVLAFRWTGVASCVRRGQ